MAENLSNVINSYKLALRNTGASTSRAMLKVATNLYDAMYQHYEYCEENQLYTHQYRICQLIDEEVLGKLDEGITGTISLQIANDLFELRKKFFALSARRILKNFALYIESYKKKKIWDKTMPTVETVFYYLDQFSLSDKLNLLRLSCMPGLGKSYIGNLFVAQSVGNNPNLSMLRITFSDDLVKITTAQTKSIISSQAYAEIFPRYQDPHVLYKGKHIFKKNDNYSFCMCDCEDEFNLFAVTRDGQATGKRAKLVVIDDLLKGEVESANVTLQKQLVDRYDSDWSSRADDDNQKTLLLGTMWSNTDLLNVLYDREAEGASLIQDEAHRFAELTEDGSSVFIGIPALDKEDNSTCPSRFSTQTLLKKRKNMSRYLWQAVYQQDPIAPDGLDFNYSVLRTYNDKKVERSDIRYGALDPARKGKNYVSMPVVYGYPKEGALNATDYRLVDFLYQKRGMDDLYEPIVDMIIKHRLNRLVVENNTDTSLRKVLEDMLHKKGYLGCEIIEKYSTRNKEQRIKDYQATIRNSIIFPAKGLYSPITDMGQAMESITSYSFNYPNKFDDGIDSIALLCMEFINNRLEFPIIGTFKRSI